MIDGSTKVVLGLLPREGEGVPVCEPVAEVDDGWVLECKEPPAPVAPQLAARAAYTPKTAATSGVHRVLVL